MPDTVTKEPSVEFMIAEFNSLQNNVIRMDETKSNRVNFFLIIVAAVIASVSGMTSNPNLLIQPNVVLAMAAFSLLLLGVAVLYEVTRLSGSIVAQYRYANRVRRWFVEHDRGIELYVAYPLQDNLPRLELDSSSLGYGGDTVILILNSAFFTAFAVAILYQLYPSSPLLLTMLVGIVAAISARFVQKNRLQTVLRRMESAMQRDVRFPLDEVIRERSDAASNQQP